MAGDVMQAVELLLSKCKALSSNHQRSEVFGR
jgi:hypothetical protein